MSVFSKGYESAINRELRNALEPVEETGFFDNAVASYNHFINEEQSISRIRAMGPELDANFDSYVKTVGAPPPEQAWAIRTISASDVELYKQAEQGDKTALSVVNRTGHIKGWKAWQFWRDVEQEYPEQIISYDQMVSNASNKLANERQKNEDVMKRASGMGEVGKFVGVMGGAITDPINVATLGFGSSVTMAKGLGNAYKLAELSAKGFAISAGTEALIQPNVYKWKKEIGSEYNVSDAIENILIAGVGGGALSALPLGAKMTYKGFKKNIDSAHFNLAKAVNKDYAIGLEAKASLKAMEGLKHAIDTSPFKVMDPSINGVRTHLTALDKAVMDLRQGYTADVAGIVKGIDDAQYPAWNKVEAAKVILEKEAATSTLDAAQAAKDLDIYNAELVELNKTDAVEKVQQELTKDGRLNKRRAKKEAKKFVESRKKELQEVASSLEKEVAPARAAKKSKDLLKKIRNEENQGKAPSEIIKQIEKERPKLVEPEPAMQAKRKITEKMPEPKVEEMPAAKKGETLQVRELIDENRGEKKISERESSPMRNAGMNWEDLREMGQLEDLELKVIDMAVKKVVGKGQAAAMLRRGLSKVREDVLTGSTLKEALITARKSSDEYHRDAVEHINAVLDANRDKVDINKPGEIRGRYAQEQPAVEQPQPQEQYRAYEQSSAESGKVSQGANKSLYGDIDDIDLINSKALQEVESRLAENDFMIPDEAGNLVSARQVLDEAIKGVDNAAELRACFIG